MGIRGVTGPCDPYDQYTNCGGPLLVTKLIGTSYDIVKFVAERMGYVRDVACNMDAVKAAAANMHRNIVTLDGIVGVAGSTTLIDLPSGIDDELVLDYSVLLIGSDENLYSQGVYFTSFITDNKLSITIAEDAPEVIENAEVRWTLTYKG